VRALLVLFALALAACGGTASGGPSSSASSSSPPSSSSSASGTSLTVTYWADGENPSVKTSTTYTGAIDVADLAPVPPSTPCTMIYGGPQKATITGTIDGQSVSAAFNRTNGCEIARWDKLATQGVLPKV
jgi:hypothetical protein